MLISIELNSETETAALGAALAPVLRPGDTILLSGPVGAGKSLLARSVLTEMLKPYGPVGDIPSPSYTLVQTYKAGGTDIWHADLYRMSGPEETIELGLNEAFGEGIVIVEWPDRLGEETPQRYLHLTLHPLSDDADARKLEVRPIGGGWDPALAALGSVRDEARTRFAAAAGWPPKPMSALAGDVSARRYFRLTGGPKDGAVVMDAPRSAGGVVRFAAVTDRLRDMGLSAPEIYAADVQAGFLLLEDLGDDLFTHVLGRDPSIEQRLYSAAVDLLVSLQRESAEGLPPYDLPIYLEEAERFLKWYLPAARGSHVSDDVQTRYLNLIEELCEPLLGASPVISLIDYHADNLIWLPERKGLSQIGLLDYQDARAGHPAYDLVSLLEDARRDVPDAVRDAMKRRYLDATGRAAEPFEAAYSVLGAQRNLKILGIFARLSVQDCRTDYLRLMPRVWANLQGDLRHPVLSGLKDWVDAFVPAPDQKTIRRLEAKA